MTQHWLYCFDVDGGGIAVNLRDMIVQAFRSINPIRNTSDASKAIFWGAGFIIR